MADDDHYEIDGSKDASEYAWRGAPGERRAYAKAYADAHSKNFNDNEGYMENVAKGADIYDKARMKSDAEAATAAAQTATTPRKIPSYRKGGKVRKTGLALLHKGEHVIPVHKVKHMQQNKKGGSK